MSLADDIANAEELSQIARTLGPRRVVNLGIQELLLEAAWSNGCTHRRYNGHERDVLQAAFSTVSLPEAMSSVMNRTSLAAYMQVMEDWRSISSVTPASDFKKFDRIRLGGDFQFEKVGASFHKSVNSAVWRGFAVGEVLFDNYEFDIEPDDHDLARLYFRVSPNATNIQIASPSGPIVVASKLGWDYLDVSYVQQPDAQGVLRKVPHTATVLVTKRYTDFNGLI